MCTLEAAQEVPAERQWQWAVLPSLETGEAGEVQQQPWQVKVTNVWAYVTKPGACEGKHQNHTEKIKTCSSSGFVARLQIVVRQNIIQYVIKGAWSLWSKD